ncbi:MAG: trypsin-like peptidase domain-containing protein [Acidobacteriota bacterium]|nr:trypsin-like peptidase domain-containing protein [Blastocatellia bacterium]MDW8411442.1 trypsin-like peptidase domain-containing protein [Acidobacteriota bacterium]
MYKLTPRQLILLSLLPSLIAATLVITYERYLRPPETTASSAPSLDFLEAKTKQLNFSADEKNNIDVYEAVSPGVVNITSITYKEDFWGFDVYPQQGTGSGTIIDKAGHILTNYHVIQGAQELKVVLADKSTYDAKFVGADPDNDLAVIKIDAPPDKLHVVPLGSSQSLAVGQKVLAIGNPFGLDRTLTTGIISGLGRPLKAANGRTIDNVIQTDASINPGNSGGPLLNSNGEVIGINTAIYSPSGGSVGIGFAVPIDIARNILPDLLTYGRVLRPWLGISAIQITPRLAARLSLDIKEGLIVRGTYPNGPAAKAGIIGSEQYRIVDNRIQLLGDILTKVDGKKIASEEDLYRALKDRRPGEVVSVEVVRDGRPIRLKVQLEARPQRL